MKVQTDNRLMGVPFGKPTGSDVAEGCWGRILVVIGNRLKKKARALREEINELKSLFVEKSRWDDFTECSSFEGSYSSEECDDSVSEVDESFEEKTEKKTEKTEKTSEKNA